MKPYYSYLLTLFVLSSASVLAQSPGCDGERYISPIFSELTETFNIKYGENTSLSGETVELLLDVFEPVESDVNERPLVLLIHGGGFVSGDKAVMHDICRGFASRGYVSATMSYRLYDGPLPPFPDSIALIGAVIDAIEDAHGAMRFFIDDAQNDDVYGIDPDMIFLGGGSAGGITSVWAAYMDENDYIPDFMAEHIDPDYGIPGASNDLTDISPEIQGVLNYSGAIYDVSWMDENDEPVFSVHDDGDPVVPYGTGFANPAGFPLISLQGPETMHAKAQELGVQSDLYIFENSPGHVSYFQDLSSAVAIEVIDSSSVFLEAIACAVPSSVDIQNKEYLNIVATPNPSSADILLEIPQEFMDGKVEVFNASGQIKYTQKVSSLNLNLNTTELGKGVFIVRVSSDPAYGSFYTTKRIVFN